MTTLDAVPIAGTTLKPSRICLGTGSFGSAISEDASFALMDRFAELGGTFFDSAHVYAAWLPNGVGASERTVGKWIRTRGCRDKVVFGTKGGHPELATMNISRLSPACIKQDLRESLERSQLEYVDLYWLHRDDPAIPVGEILGVLNELLREKRIRAFGCSNWIVPRMEECAAYAARSGLQAFCASQISFSLRQEAPRGSYSAGAMVSMDETTFEFHRRTQLAQIPYSSQANGFFAKPLAEKGVSEINIKRWHAAQKIAKARGCSPNQAALAWLIAQPFPVLPIVGSHTRAQIDDTCGAASIKLSDAELQEMAAANGSNHR